MFWISPEAVKRHSDLTWHVDGHGDPVRRAYSMRKLGKCPHCDANAGLHTDLLPVYDEKRELVVATCLCIDCGGQYRVVIGGVFGGKLYRSLIMKGKML